MEFWKASDESGAEAEIEKVSDAQFLLTTDGPMGYPTPTINLDREQLFKLHLKLIDEFKDQT